MVKSGMLFCDTHIRINNRLSIPYFNESSTAGETAKEPIFSVSVANGTSDRERVKKACPNDSNPTLTYVRIVEPDINTGDK